MELERDEITIIIADVIMKVQRSYSISVPHEVTAVIPRAELRRWRYQNGQLIEVSETILNSITIAHSPRHPSEQRGSSAVARGDSDSALQPGLTGFNANNSPGTSTPHSGQQQPALPSYPRHLITSKPTTTASYKDNSVTGEPAQAGGMESAQRGGYRITWRPSPKV